MPSPAEQRVTGGRIDAQRGRPKPPGEASKARRVPQDADVYLRSGQRSSDVRKGPQAQRRAPERDADSTAESRSLSPGSAQVLAQMAELQRKVERMQEEALRERSEKEALREDNERLKRRLDELQIEVQADTPGSGSRTASLDPSPAPAARAASPGGTVAAAAIAGAGRSQSLGVPMQQQAAPGSPLGVGPARGRVVPNNLGGLAAAKFPAGPRGSAGRGARTQYPPSQGQVPADPARRGLVTAGRPHPPSAGPSTSNGG